MKAIQFTITIPRYLTGLAVRKVAPSLLWTGLSCASMSDVPEPSLPTSEWVKIRTRLGGVCGSDLSIIHLYSSLYFSPFTSSPFVLGHENVGTISEIGSDVQGWEPGERVIVEPPLWCRPRGFNELCPACEKGEINRCEKTTEGDVAPGLFIGTCRDTGGSWSPNFVAHSSQLVRVPPSISDENALMVEPFACGLHAVLQSFPNDDDTVLIVGAGTIGLVTLAALRGLGSQARILVSARYPFQADAARQLGADVVLQGGDLYAGVASETNATRHKPMIGKDVVVGGVDHTFECVGADATLDDALRLTRAGGKLSLVGVPAVTKNVDWSAIFLQELQINAAYIYNHVEHYAGKTWRTFDLAFNLIEAGKVDLAPLVTHRFALDDYSQALKMHMNRRQHSIIKAVFDFRNQEFSGR